MKQNNKSEKNLPIATEIIRDYKKNNKKLFIVNIILVAFLFIETTYLVLLLDSLNNSVGVITEEVSKCD